jgi:hypothetical protein
VGVRIFLVSPPSYFHSEPALVLHNTRLEISEHREIIVGMDDGPENGESVNPAIPEAGEHMQPQGTAPQQEKDVEYDPTGGGLGDISNPLDTESKQWANTVSGAEDQSTAAEQSERKVCSQHRKP